MISRRLLRIKALHILFAFFRGENDSLAKAEKELFHSINKGYDLYNYLFLLLLEIKNFAQKRIETAKQKLMPTHEDLNPNMRFVENPYFTLISENESIHNYLTYNKLSWVNYPELIKKLFQKISASDYYQKYMELPSPDFAAHRQVLVNILSKELIDFDDFVQCLEEQSIYWNDDLDFMIGMVVKTLKKFEPGQDSSTPIFPMFKNDDDVDFAKRLLRKAVMNHDKNTQVIDQYTKNWDVERIASMDILIMEMALTEITDFPSIPVKVSFNEYIEISKYYSTDQSSTFINGVLDKIIAAYRAEGKINKQGRGLVGEEDS
ncbi:MAG: transcription antitermination factor NusB [Bacteroidales bacterium]|nr:transcription antitermination factor NusB [Bacteroidales bacterium]MDY0255185.1 transcription antitermination factor NusB [Tenuifilaceae bacterium]